MASYVLFEVYNNYRMWALTRGLISDIRDLYILLFVCSVKETDELRRLLDVIKVTDFAGCN